MVAMDLNTLTWCERGNWANLAPSMLTYTLQGLNDKIMKADRRLSDARGMSGIGFVDRTAKLQDIGDDLGTINQ